MDKILLDNYLKYLQEGEKSEIKYSTGPVYLYHGTRNIVEQIKKRGLTVKDNGSEIDTRTKGRRGIWFTSSLKYASIYTKEGNVFSKKVGIILKCKLDKKYLIFIENLYLFDEYIYVKDIPPKDIEIVWKAKE